MFDFSNRGTKTSERTDEVSKSEINKVAIELNRKLDLLSLKEDLMLREQTSSEKQLLKGLQTHLEDFMTSLDDTTVTTKDKMVQRSQLYIYLKKLETIVDDIKDGGGLSSAHFSSMSLTIKLLPQILADFKKVCIVRGQTLEIGFKMILAVVSSAMSQVLSYSENNEKQIWKQASDVNKTVENEIRKISRFISDHKKLQEQWSKDLELSRKEAAYLAKMVRKLAHHNDLTLSHLKTLELEKEILANDLATLKVEIYDKTDRSPSKSSNYKTAFQPNDPNHQKWLVIKDNIEAQYHVRSGFMVEFQKEFGNLVSEGLMRVRKHDMVYQGSIREIGTSTADLIDFRDKSTQCGMNLIKDTRKKVCSDSSTQQNFKDIVLAQVSSEEIYAKSNKLDARYTLHYQLAKSPALKQLLDGYIMCQSFDMSDDRHADFQRMVVDQQAYRIVNSDLVKRISQSLESVDMLKLRYNSLGDTLATMEKENRTLKENCSMYETQNDDLMKKIGDMNNTIAELSMNQGSLKMDMKNFDQKYKKELAQLVAEYALEIKDKLLEVCTKEKSNKSSSRKELSVGGVTMNPMRNSARYQPSLKNAFEKAVSPYTEYDPEGINQL